MSEIRINIINQNQAISGDLHGSFGDVLVASLTAEPETVEELETAVERFISRDSDWSVFRGFRMGENFEPWDAGLLVIDLVARLIMADSTYSYFSTEGKILVKTDEEKDFYVSYQLSGDWKRVGSMPEFEFQRAKRREEILQNPPFDAREVLFGKPLSEFILAEYSANKDSTDEDLFTEIHAKWLMTKRTDLKDKTPREVLLEKCDFIEADLESRALQWSFTSVQPPALPENTNAYKFAGFGRHEIVMYYDLVRFLLGECFAREITQAEVLEQFANDWLNNPQEENSGRTPSSIIELERKRINLTASAHECVIDEDCEFCQMMALDFIDTPMFWHFDGSQMEYDRFEFSFEQDREKWEAEQKYGFGEVAEREDASDDNFFDENQEIF